MWHLVALQISYWTAEEPLNILFVQPAHDYTVPPIELCTKGNISGVLWSETGRLLLAYSVAEGQHFLEIFEVASQRLLVRVPGKPSSDNIFPVNFGTTDDYVYRILSDGIGIYDLRGLKNESSGEALGPVFAEESFKIDIKGIKAVISAPPREDGRYLLACFMKEGPAHKNGPATVRVGAVNFVTKEWKNVTSKTLNQVQECALHFNSTGTHLLFKMSQDVDQSGASYYGSSSLHLMDISRSCTTVVVPQESGPVHTFAWSKKDPLSFFCLSGQLPCSIMVYSASNGQPRLDLGKSRRNYLAQSADGRLALIAGFGNLPGDSDVWDMSTNRVVGVSKISWTVQCSFSPDGYWLLSSTTSPRLRVDNGIRILRVTGDLVFSESRDELYRASWRPTSEAARPLTPGRKFHIPKEDVYVPKGLAAALAASLDGISTLAGRTMTAKSVDAHPPAKGPSLPLGLDINVDAKPKRGKKSGVSGGVVPPKPANLEFTIEEFPSLGNDVQAASEAGADKQAADLALAGIKRLGNLDLCKKLMKISKTIGEAEKLQSAKKLDFNQRRKLEKLPTLQREAAWLNEEVTARQLNIKEVLDESRK